jgi:hypothetical protein
MGPGITSEIFTRVLEDRGVHIGMDGMGGWVDNVLVLRLWRSVKHENIYLAHGRVQLKLLVLQCAWRTRLI